MDCRRAKKSLMEYVDGGLSGKRQEEVGLHLESCRECSALAERLKTSASALSSLAPVEMPPEASRRVLSALKSSERSAPAYGFFHSPRALAVAGGAALLLALAVTVGIFARGGPTQKPQLSKNVQQTVASGVSEESPADKGAQSSASAPAGELALPVARVTEMNYNQESAKAMAEHLEVKNTFAERYSMSDVVNLRSTFAQKLADDFSTMGGDGAALEAMISFIQSTEPVLLPCYVEKAQFAGENVYIIGLCGPPRSGDVKKLTRTEFWALNPQEFTSNPEASLCWWGQSIKQ